MFRKDIIRTFCKVSLFVSDKAVNHNTHEQCDLSLPDQMVLNENLIQIVYVYSVTNYYEKNNSSINPVASGPVMGVLVLFPVKGYAANLKPVHLDTATFATGCFWCTESKFHRQLNGVVKVVSQGLGGGHGRIHLMSRFVRGHYRTCRGLQHYLRSC